LEVQRLALKINFFWKKTMLRDHIIEELDQIPEVKMAEIYDFLHYYRLGLQQPMAEVNSTLSLAGAWKDRPNEEFDDLLNELTQRRKQAFSGRRPQ
jgi:hypothetical protein